MCLNVLSKVARNGSSRLHLFSITRCWVYAYMGSATSAADAERGGEGKGRRMADANYCFSQQEEAQLTTALSAFF